MPKCLACLNEALFEYNRLPTNVVSSVKLKLFEALNLCGLSEDAQKIRQVRFDSIGYGLCVHSDCGAYTLFVYDHIREIKDNPQPATGSKRNCLACGFANLFGDKELSEGQITGVKRKISELLNSCRMRNAVSIFTDVEFKRIAHNFCERCKSYTIVLYERNFQGRDTAGAAARKRTAADIASDLLRP